MGIILTIAGIIIGFFALSIILGSVAAKALNLNSDQAALLGSLKPEIGRQIGRNPTIGDLMPIADIIRDLPPKDVAYLYSFSRDLPERVLSRLVNMTEADKILGFC